jgi:hypothetical protein
MNDFVDVGAIWEKEKGMSGQLNNGMRIFLSNNKYKEPGDKRPVYNLRMLLADAAALGIAEKAPRPTPTTSTPQSSGDVPF